MYLKSQEFLELPTVLKINNRTVENISLSRQFFIEC